MSVILRFRDTTDPTKVHDVKALRGLNAYQLAVKNGYTGTETEWIASITGVEGKSAYEVAQAEGYEGTKAAWLASLKGEKGDKGDKGDTGAPGTNGTNGTDGKSAYQLAQDGGYEGSQAQWLASLKAPDPSVVEKTITASMWGSTVTISNALITATNSVAMIPGKNITNEQLKALQKANIQDCGTQVAGSITLKIFGTVPTIDIPVRLIIGGVA